MGPNSALVEVRSVGPKRQLQHPVARRALPYIEPRVALFQIQPAEVLHARCARPADRRCIVDRVPVGVGDAQCNPFLLPLLHAHHQRIRMRSSDRSLIRKRSHARRRHARRRAVGRAHHIQVAAPGSAVPNVEHDAHRKRPLNIHVVGLHHTQPIVLVHGIIILNRLCSRAPKAIGERHVGRRRGRRRHASRCCGRRIRSARDRNIVGLCCGERRLERERLCHRCKLPCVVVDAVSRADHRIFGELRLPRHAEARRNHRAVGLHQAARKLSFMQAGLPRLYRIDLAKVRIVVQVHQPVVLLRIGREVLIAHAVVQRPGRRQAEVVRRIPVVDVLAQIDLVQPRLDRCTLRQSQQKIREARPARRRTPRGFVCRALRRIARERKLPQRIIAADRVRMHPAHIQPDAHIVLLVPIRNEVREADRLVDQLARRRIGKPRKIGDVQRRQAVIKPRIGKPARLIRNRQPCRRRWIVRRVGEVVPRLRSHPVPGQRRIVREPSIPNRVPHIQSIAVGLTCSAQRQKDIPLVAGRMRVVVCEVDILPQRWRQVRVAPATMPPAATTAAEQPEGRVGLLSQRANITRVDGDDVVACIRDRLVVVTLRIGRNIRRRIVLQQRQRLRRDRRRRIRQVILSHRQPRRRIVDRHRRCNAVHHLRRLRKVARALQRRRHARRTAQECVQVLLPRQVEEQELARIRLGQPRNIRRRCNRDAVLIRVRRRFRLRLQIGRPLGRVQRPIASLVKNAPMRLRWIEVPKRPAAKSTAAAAMAAATESTAAAPAIHHPPQHPDDRIGRIAPLRNHPTRPALRHRVLHALPNLVLAEVRQPIRLPRLPGHRHRIRRFVANPRQRRQRRSRIRLALARIRHIQITRAQAQPL